MAVTYIPILSSIASRVLAQPASASAAERNWSVYGRTHSAQKARMKHGTADKLVYCHETLHLEKEMVDAGWEPDAARCGRVTARAAMSLRPPMISLMNKNCSWTLRRS